MNDYPETAAGESKSVHLSLRQSSVLRRLATGMTMDEIGADLEISTRTVRAHVEHLKRKLGVDRTRNLPQAFRDATGVEPAGLGDRVVDQRQRGDD